MELYASMRLMLRCRNAARFPTNIVASATAQTMGSQLEVMGPKPVIKIRNKIANAAALGPTDKNPETGAGGISVKLVNTGGERHDSDLETGAGDITVYIAADVAINVRASMDLANGHRITSDFPDIHITSEGGQWEPKTYTAEGKLNGGGPTLKVHTSTGDIRFKRASR